MKHVALIDDTGSVELHEELTDERAEDRYRMFAVQVDLNAQAGTPGYRAYIGEAWPPPGVEE